MNSQIEIPEDLLNLVRRNMRDESEHHMKDFTSRWNGLNDQRKENLFCDALLKCGEEGTIFPAHKCVLVISSPYFKTMFTSLLTHPKRNEHVIDLKEYSKRSIGILLDYVYTGSADLNYVDLPELLQLVEFLQCNWIIELLVKAIRVTMSGETWFLWFTVGINCGVDALTTLSISYMISHRSSLAGTEGLSPALIDKVANIKHQMTLKHINLYYNMGQIYYVDVARKVVEKRNTGPCCLKNFVPNGPEEFRVHSFFVFEGRLHRAAVYWFDVSTSPILSGDLHVQLSFYEQCPQKFQSAVDNESISMTTLMEKVDVSSVNVDNLVEMSGSFWVKQLTFDGLNHLYILVGNFICHLIFKYDLRAGGCMLPNYIWLTAASHTDLFRQDFFCFVESKRRGTLLVGGLDHVYDIENFDFSLTEHFPSTHEVAKVKTQVKLSPDSYNGRKTNDNRRVPTDARCLRSWKVVSVIGEVYSFVIFAAEKSNLVVLHFDTDISTWVEIFHLPIVGYQLSNAFVCSGKPYVVLSLELFQQRDYDGGDDGDGGNSGTKDAKDISYYTVDEMYEVMHEFDAERKTMAAVNDMFMPPFGKRFMCSEVPAYFLV